MLNLTFGFLLGSFMPDAIRENIEERWTQKIAEYYINVNLLSKLGYAKLILVHLDEWYLTIRSKLVTCNHMKK